MQSDRGQKHVHKSSCGSGTLGSNDDAASARRITSDVLLAGHREMVIVHTGIEYRLRVTCNGKLILTK